MYLTIVAGNNCFISNINDTIAITVGMLEIDFIGKFENLQEDFKKVSEKINIDTELLHKNKTNHLDYTQYFKPEHCAIVNSVYEEDFRYLLYQKNSER